MIKENILVSHNQIIIRSIPFDEDIQKWDEESLEKGIIWNKNYVVLDPLVDVSFGCWFLIDKKEELLPSETSIRSAIIPFEITNETDFSINTVSESVKLYKDPAITIEEEQSKGIYFPLNTLQSYRFEEGSYCMLFEICMGKPTDEIEEDEVYYRFIFKKEARPVFKVLKDDPYGWDTHFSL